MELGLTLTTLIALHFIALHYMYYIHFRMFYIHFRMFIFIFGKQKKINSAFKCIDYELCMSYRGKTVAKYGAWTLKTGSMHIRIKTLLLF